MIGFLMLADRTQSAKHIVVRKWLFASLVRVINTAAHLDKRLLVVCCLAACWRSAAAAAAAGDATFRFDRSAHCWRPKHRRC